MVKEILHNIWIWSWYSEEKGYNFNGTIVSDGRTKVLIDPIKMGDGVGVFQGVDKAFAEFFQKELSS